MEKTIADDIISLILDENLPIFYRFHLYILVRGIVERAKR